MDFLAHLLPAGIAAHAPVLLVVIPLILAPIAALMPSGRIAWAISLIAAFLVALLALVLLGEVSQAGSVSYHLGGWAPALGIEYRVDALDVPILLLVGFVRLLCTIYALPSVGDEIEPGKQPMFYSGFLVMFTGLAGRHDHWRCLQCLRLPEVSSSRLMPRRIGGGKTAGLTD